MFYIPRSALELMELIFNVLTSEKAEAEAKATACSYCSGAY